MARHSSATASIIGLLATVVTFQIRSSGAPTTQPADPARRLKAVEFLAKAEGLPVPKAGSGLTGTDLVEAHIRLGQLPEARRAFDAIGDPNYLKLSPAKTLVRALMKTGDTAGAKAVLSSIEAPSGGPGLADYAALQAGAGDDAGTRVSLEILSKLSEPTCYSQGLAAVAVVEFEAGNKKAAATDFAKAAEVTRADQDPLDMQFKSVGRIAIQAEQAGDHETAKKLIESDTDAADAAQASVMIAYSNHDPAEREHLAKLLESMNSALIAQGPIADDPGNYFSALMRQAAWAELADGWLDVGDNAKARTAIAEAQKLAERVIAEGNPNMPGGSMSLLNVAGLLDRVGDHDAARKVVDHAVAATNKLPAARRAEELWMIAGSEAAGILSADVPRIVKLAIKAGPVDETTGGSVYIGRVARTLSARLGTSADLSWIESLPTDTSKAAACAGAAAGLLADDVRTKI